MQKYSYINIYDKCRSERAKQTLNNKHSNVNELEDYGTRKKLLNTKIEPHLDGSVKNNVVGGTVLRRSH